jgi:sugar/nucleoside kinase (ribokinase family)
LDALFIGHSYIDVTMLAPRLPQGDEKSIAQDYAVSFGGNAATAAFCCAKLGTPPDLLVPIARDWLAHMFQDMAATFGLRLHTRRVARSSLSFVFPHKGQRSILRARDDHYLQDFPRLDISSARLLHFDGHMADAALHYARAGRDKGVLVSLDGGTLRPGLLDLLEFVDVAIVAMDLCRKMRLSEGEMLDFLKGKGARVAGVTDGERGLLWREGDGAPQRQPALKVPSERIIDTSGAGDVFHGAYCASFLDRPDAPWREHFDFARAASAYKVQHLGNEAGLPSKADIALAQKRLGETVCLDELIPESDALDG